MVLELKILKLIELNCPSFDDLPLLPDTESLKVIKTKPHMLV